MSYYNEEMNHSEPSPLSQHSLVHCIDVIY
jgi:hypothetical protein